MHVRLVRPSVRPCARLQLNFDLDILHVYGHDHSSPVTESQSCVNYVSILYRFRDRASYRWPKFANFNVPHLHLPSLEVTPVEFRGNVWHQRTTR